MTDLTTNPSLADSTDLLSDTSTSGLDLITGGYKVSQETVDNTGLDQQMGGTGNDELLGRGYLGNFLSGMDGDDTIVGGGGTASAIDLLWGGFGNDTLTGGAGIDLFYFASNSQLEGIDIIKDFSAADGDNLYLNAAGFGVTPGDYSAFSYDLGTGNLSFNGQQFAQLQPGTDFIPSRDIDFEL